MTNKQTVADKPKTAREIRAAAAADRARRDVKAALRKERGERINGTVKAVIVPVFFLAIAIVALSASFAHLRDLCILAGQDASHWYSPANSTPLIIDFMMLIASVQLRRIGITGTARFIARVAMTSGLAASVAGNLGSRWMTLTPGQSTLQTTIDLAVAVAPALVLWLAVEMLTHTRKTAKAKKRAGLVRRVLTAWVARIEHRLTVAPTATTKAAPVEQAPERKPSWTVFDNPVVASLKN